MITRLPVGAEDSLCVIDGLTGSRTATLAILDEDRLIGLETPPALLIVEAGTTAALGAGARIGGAGIPRGAIRIRGDIWTAAQVARWIEALAERAQVWEAVSRFHLDRNDAADLLAARAYVWARNMLPMNGRYWSKVPMTGFVTDWVAEEVMRNERANPGTAMSAVRGDPAALRAIDGIVDRVVAATGAEQGPGIVERTSAASPALSAHSTRARTLLGIMGNQRWQAHHIIPFGTVARLPAGAQQAIAGSGWRMDSLVNLIALPANLASFLLPPNLGQYPYHNGSHGHYDVDVWLALQPIATGASLMVPSAVRAMMDGVDVRFRVALRMDPRYKPRLN